VFYALALKSKSLINLEAEGGKIYRSLDTGKTVIISTIIVNNNVTGKYNIFHFYQRRNRLAMRRSSTIRGRPVRCWSWCYSRKGTATPHHRTCATTA